MVVTCRMRRPQLDEAYLFNFCRGVLGQALRAAEPDYWARRADDARNAYPRPGDHPGQQQTARVRAERTIRSLRRVYAFELRRLEALGLQNASDADIDRHTSFGRFASFELAELRDNPTRHRDPARGDLNWSPEEREHLNLVHRLVVHDSYLRSVA